MFEKLEEINSRPAPFQFHTARELWTDDHTSQKMLDYHLNGDIDVSSRNIKFIDRSVDWIVSRFGVKENTRIADFGCGPGLYAQRLAGKKADVTGIDFSSRSIEYARKTAAAQGLAINYVVRDYLEFETEARFDLITMIMCDFCALGPENRTRLLKKFHRLARPGGGVLLDVYTLNWFEQRKEEAKYEADMLDGFWSAQKNYGFLNTFKYDDEKVVLDKYTIIEKNRTRRIYNWLQCFNRESIEKEFEAGGFKIVEYFSDVAGTAYDPESLEMAVAAIKK